MDRAPRVKQLRQTREVLDKTLALLESNDADKFVSQLCQAQKQYRVVCERPNKGNKAIER